MYSIDEHDKVIELKEFPFWPTGNPMPTVVVDERSTFLCYVVNELYNPNFLKLDTEIISTSEESERFAIIYFNDCADFKLGYPNDEGLDDHPLYGRGLTFYAAHEVVNSSWIRQVGFSLANYHHYILTFKDSTFECIATGFEVKKIVQASRSVAMEQLGKLLGE